MPASTEMAFDELVQMAKKLPTAQWNRLKQVVDRSSVHSKSKNDLVELLLKGPTFSSAQLEQIENARKEISTWRKE